MPDLDVNVNVEGIEEAERGSVSLAGKILLASTAFGVLNSSIKRASNGAVSFGNAFRNLSTISGNLSTEMRALAVATRVPRLEWNQAGFTLVKFQAAMIGAGRKAQEYGDRIRDVGDAVSRSARIHRIGARALERSLSAVKDIDNRPGLATIIRARIALHKGLYAVQLLVANGIDMLGRKFVKLGGIMRTSTRPWNALRGVLELTSVWAGRMANVFGALATVSDKLANAGIGIGTWLANLLRNGKAARVATEGLNTAMLASAGAANLSVAGVRGLAIALDSAGKNIRPFTRWVQNLGGEINKAVGGIKGFIAKALAIKTAMTIAALGIAAVTAAGTAMVAIFVAMAKRVEEFTRQARKLGTSIEELQGLKFAAEQAGTSINTLVLALRNVDKDKLAALGVDGSGAERINQLADAFARLATDEERAALATELFGRQGSDLIPLLEGGRLGLKQWNDELKSTGNVISDEAAEGFRKLNDEFNIVKNTIIGFVTSVSTEALPLIQAAVGNFKIALDTLKGPIEAITFVTKEWIRVNQVFGSIGRSTSEDIYTIGLQAGFTRQQVDNLKDSFGRGFIPALTEYISVGGDWASLQERQHVNEQELTRAYLENRIALNAQTEARLVAEQGLLGEVSATEHAQTAARGMVSAYGRASQAQGQARLQAIALAGAIENGIITKNADITANENLAASIDTVTVALGRQARLRGAGLAFAAGDIEGTFQSAPGLQSNLSIPSVGSASSVGSSSGGIAGTLEQAVARAMGRVVTSDLPISMEKAIEAATLDWNMQQTNEGTLELLRQGQTNFESLLEDERDRQEFSDRREKEKLEFERGWWEVNNEIAKRQLEVQREQRDIAAAEARARHQTARGFLNSAPTEGLSSSQIAAFYRSIAQGESGTSTNIGTDTRGRYVSVNGQRVYSEGSGIELQINTDGSQIVEVVNNGISVGDVNVD